ncbi:MULTISPECIES: sensor histidine kinase [Streptomyces]|uniref:Signal transduction histidine kinase subgroup 3 dimerisation and phosphoacceptor domain-containing protein n=5 Tax=Streptomyces TaxID=1883 RepID=A0A8H9LVI7_9ACTN|nr:MULTISPECIES: histidine kinase [Streptomyces]NEE24916.1 two-component sensor histidine kinase [Streptomyces sp. SID7982]NEE58782.1 two-component sensor histidine kinase [Streptomyces sp. SID8455]MBL3806084.1 two-component sensor histidine kinase [Streptomyces sp. BRB081]MDQ0294354.1 two-component system sensor histidine kinase DesK [Streptomyces sp. DSM 41037]QNE81749.1 two-component sensor histidine kinase [Streptomyces rutgersensis]
MRRGDDEPLEDSGSTGKARPDTEEEAATPGARADHLYLPAPRLARIILVVVLLGYLSVTAINLAAAPHTRFSLVLSFVCQAGVFLLQIRHSGAGARHAPLWGRCVTLGCQAALTYVPLIFFRSQWGSMAGFLAGSLLLLLPPRRAWPAYGLVGSTMAIPPLLEGLPLRDAFYLAQSSLLTGLVVYGLSRLAELVKALHDTRIELTRMAVTQERLRFARDLHDLLGYSLSVITLKSELIHRLVPSHPERAMEEVGEVLAVSRKSLADVRSVAAGLRGMSLEQELASAESLLRSADVTVHSDIRLGEIDPQVDTVLAAVAREAITNLLRHSRASVCAITSVQDDGVVRLRISNDGVDPSYRDVSPHSGSGLGNLETRLGAVSGRLSVSRAGDETFTLIAEVPAHPAPGAPARRAEAYAQGPTA